jgi:hypothetical protein
MYYICDHLKPPTPNFSFTKIIESLNLFLLLFSGEAHQMGYLASGKLLKVGVEFSLEDPQGGIHFVVPEGNIGE